MKRTTQSVGYGVNSVRTFGVRFIRQKTQRVDYKVQVLKEALEDTKFAYCGGSAYCSGLTTAYLEQGPKENCYIRVCIPLKKPDTALTGYLIKVGQTCGLGTEIREEGCSYIIYGNDKDTVAKQLNIAKELAIRIGQVTRQGGLLVILVERGRKGSPVLEDLFLGI